MRAYHTIPNSTNFDYSQPIRINNHHLGWRLQTTITAAFQCAPCSIFYRERERERNLFHLIVQGKSTPKETPNLTRRPSSTGLDSSSSVQTSLIATQPSLQRDSRCCLVRASWKHNRSRRYDAPQGVRQSLDNDT